MAALEETSPIAEERARVVAAAIARIRKIEETEGVSPATLDKIRVEMLKLAERKELFPESDYPQAEGDAIQVRYLVHEEPGDRFTLYMNSMKPGKTANPHDHSDSWAVVVAVEGEEENVLWNVVEEDMAAGKAKIEPTDTVMVQPGQGVTLMPRQVHSIAIKGERPTMHLHLYGHSLESMTGRRGFNPERGLMYEFAAPGKTVGKD